MVVVLKVKSECLSLLLTQNVFSFLPYTDHLCTLCNTESQLCHIHWSHDHPLWHHMLHTLTNSDSIVTPSYTILTVFHFRILIQLCIIVSAVQNKLCERRA